MNPQEPGPAVLTFYRYTLMLCAWLLTRDVPLQDATMQATTLAMFAWLLVNRWWVAED
jgi:hypothetical protein